MHHIILGLLFLLSGFFMKLSDDYSDINKDLKLASLTGILCAIASFLATVYDVDAACILIGILIGNFLVLKVDVVAECNWMFLNFFYDYLEELPH